MRRRKFITLLGGAAATLPVAARAQQPAIPVIGVLSPETPTSPYVEALRAGMRELGYVEERNIRYEYRWAEGHFERLPDLAAQLVHLKVDVIIAFVTAASLAARDATATIPIVMEYVYDPVGVGLITSLAHPGGNVTGTSGVTALVFGKELELLKETAPNVTRFAVLSNPANVALQRRQVEEVNAVARNLGVELQLLEARAPDEFDDAFAAIDKERTKALLLLPDPLFNIHIRRLVELSVKRHLVTISGTRPFIDAGGLMAYGPNYLDFSKYTAVYIDKILKGAKPADLPVEQPTKFEFVVNRKAAKALGIDLPTSILLRADEVIE